MNAETVQTARRALDQRAAAQAAARADLEAALVEAQRDGATIAQLMEWTGYSRRQVFKLLGAVRQRSGT